MQVRESGPVADDHFHRDLAIALGALIAFGPLLSFLVGRPKLFGYLEATVLLYALYRITRRKSDVVFGLALGLPAVVGMVVDTATPDRPAFKLGPLVVATLFFGFLVWRILRDVLAGDRRTSERVLGAISAYLLIGLMFAGVHAFVALAEPGAYAISDAILASESSAGGEHRMSVFTYFSFVTMTTVGYGDITPVSLVARTLAFLEALVGQLYVAVMIAGLVGMHISRRSA
jgi:hypothetical protein